MSTPAPRHIPSLDDYLAALEERGDVLHITEPADLRLEVAAGIRYAFEQNLPALVYDTIKGHPGYRIMGGLAPYSSDARHRYGRVALALGLPWETHPLEVVERMAAIDVEQDLIPPVTVEDTSGRVLADEVDLFSIPSPLLHAGDGGDYLNTIGTMIARTPDGSWTNWHVCRVMRLDARRLTIWTRPVQHFGMIYRKWRALGEPMPFALAIGTEPAATVLSGLRVPAYVDEAAFLGGWFGEPLEVNRAHTVDLEVPATAHLVIEGFIQPGDRAPEGPFGEFHGYLLPDEVGEELVGRVTAISAVPRPVLGAVPAGKPVDDDHTLNQLGQSVMHHAALVEAELPVSRVWLNPEGANHLAVVTVRQDWTATFDGGSADLVRAVADTLLHKSHTTAILTHVLVAEDDIDPTDLRDVLWAWSTRVRPGSDHVVTERPIFNLSPIFTPAERAAHSGPIAFHNGLIKDAATAAIPSTFDAVYPEEVKARVLAALRARECGVAL
jgi:UbiD family decarboxylase